MEPNRFFSPIGSLAATIFLWLCGSFVFLHCDRSSNKEDEIISPLRGGEDQSTVAINKTFQNPSLDATGSILLFASGRHISDEDLLSEGFNPQLKIFAAVGENKADFSKATFLNEDLDIGSEIYVTISPNGQHSLIHSLKDNASLISYIPIPSSLLQESENDSPPSDTEAATLEIEDITAVRRISFSNDSNIALIEAIGANNVTKVYLIAMPSLSIHEITDVDKGEFDFNINLYDEAYYLFSIDAFGQVFQRTASNISGLQNASPSKVDLGSEFVTDITTTGSSLIYLHTTRASDNTQIAAIEPEGTEQNKFLVKPKNQIKSKQIIDSESSYNELNFGFYYHRLAATSQEDFLIVRFNEIFRCDENAENPSFASTLGLLSKSEKENLIISPGEESYEFASSHCQEGLDLKKIVNKFDGFTVNAAGKADSFTAAMVILKGLEEQLLIVKSISGNYFAADIALE